MIYHRSLNFYSKSYDERSLSRFTDVDIFVRLQAELRDRKGCSRIHQRHRLNYTPTTVHRKSQFYTNANVCFLKHS